MELGQSIRSGNSVLTKTKDAQSCGDYCETIIDQQKKSVDFLLIQVGPNIVDSKIPLKGRGIVPSDSVPGRYRLSDKALEKLQSECTWMPNF